MENGKKELNKVRGGRTKRGCRWDRVCLSHSGYDFGGFWGGVGLRISTVDPDPSVYPVKFEPW